MRKTLQNDILKNLQMSYYSKMFYFRMWQVPLTLLYKDVSEHVFGRKFIGAVDINLDTYCNLATTQ